MLCAISAFFIRWVSIAVSYKIYDYLNNPISSLPGVGDKAREALHRLGCFTFLDLLSHLPSKVVFRSVCANPDKVESNSEQILSLKFLEISTNTRGKVKKVYCDSSGIPVELVYFNYFPYHFFSNKKYGDNVVVLGSVKNINGVIQIAHPLIYKTIEEIPKISVVYPLTYAMTSSLIHKLVNIILMNLKKFSVPEWISAERSSSWPSFIKAFDSIHNPTCLEDIYPTSKYRRRLAFDDLVASTLAGSIARMERDKNCGIGCSFVGDLKRQILEKLQFTLTEGQVSALIDIEADQKSEHRMMRLLQGDVGSGKTLVALCAILNVIEGGHQAVLMAPTDILANQHFNWISGLGIKVDLLTGKITGKNRKRILDDLRHGQTKILIGTHAIFQDNVEFQDLRLVVIDEQQRFGVQQRMALMNKGKDTDVLVMSATPIPRTLSLTIYGDMDISIISDKPKGRMPIITYALQEGKVASVIEMIKNKLSNRDRVYWICPLIEGDPEGDSKAVENRFLYLKKIFAEEVGVLHGKLPQEQKDFIMNEFAIGKISILVSTTVVEVGVDVPEATLLIIESPDRFGLAQLHQLRGRVGRGSKQSECVLLYSPDSLTNSAVEKIKIMKNSNDGFYIAEQDLKLRGAGSVLGSKQSGLPDFKLADLEFHHDLLFEASKYAKEMLANANNPEIQEKIDFLLNIFGYRKNFNLLDAG